MFLGVFVCLFVCTHSYPNTNEYILMRFFMYKRKKFLNFGKDLADTLYTKNENFQLSHGSC